jgi:hypothetical protein
MLQPYAEGLQEMVVALWPQNISEPDALLLKRSKWLCVGITDEMRFTLWQPVA